MTVLGKLPYEAIFIKKPKIVIVYIEKIYYGVQSLKRNDYNIDWVYYKSLIERLARAYNQWFKNDCPFWKDTVFDDQVEFLWSLPSS